MESTARIKTAKGNKIRVSDIGDFRIVGRKSMMDMILNFNQCLIEYETEEEFKEVFPQSKNDQHFLLAQKKDNELKQRQRDLRMALDATPNIHYTSLTHESPRMAIGKELKSSMQYERYYILAAGSESECNEYKKKAEKKQNRQLDLYEEYSETSNTTQHSFGNDVFIVHGRDDGAKDGVARFVTDLELKPIILQEQPDRGNTVIEKLERCSSNVGYAIALVTPDDIGTLKDKEDDELNDRARQNVVFELGYFMGKLGRDRVCLLLKDKVELPSDIGGIVYIPMDPNDGWKAKLQRNIRAVIKEIPDE